MIAFKIVVFQQNSLEKKNFYPRVDGNNLMDMIWCSKWNLVVISKQLGSCLIM
jgi:hypothetical protein